MMVERQTIPHLNAPFDGSKILGEQLCSFLRGCHTTSSLKSVFFTRKVAWSSLIKLHGCSWNILKPTSRAFKWSIICLSSISGSHSNPLFTKYSNPADEYIWASVYHIHHFDHEVHENMYVYSSDVWYFSIWHSSIPLECHWQLSNWVGPMSNWVGSMWFSMTVLKYWGSRIA